MRQACVLLLFVATMIATAGVLRTYGFDVFSQPPVAPPPANADQQPFSADELDSLLAPIALYPDPLLAQILPAATDPQAVAAAAAWIAAGNNPDQIDDQPWDPSILALARYPDVLKMLAENPDWTDALGYAFSTQQADVTASIQRLRARAQTAGSLLSTPEQQVVADDAGIQIVPANPQVIFVPVYDPQVVFAPPPPGVVMGPPVTFGPPMQAGVWLTNDFNWINGYVMLGGGWRYRRGDVWISVNNRPTYWPRSWNRWRPGWDGRPQPWRPPPGRPPFRPRPPSRPPPPRPPGGPGRPPRPPGVGGGNRPGTGRPPGPPGRPNFRPLPAPAPGFNRPSRPTDEDRGRPGPGNTASGRPGGPGRPGGSPAQRPGRPGGLGDMDRPTGGRPNSDRGRESRSGSSARPSQPGRGAGADGSANSAARNSARGAQSRGQAGGGRGGGAGGARGGGSGGNRGGGARDGGGGRR